MTTNNTSGESENIVSDYYEGYADVQKDVLAIEIRKTRNILFTLAGIIFIGDLLSLVAASAIEPLTILIIALIPLVLVGLAFLSTREPLVAIIIGAILIIGIWIYNIVITGGQAAIMGWMIKAVIVYLIFAGIQHAREATRIKKELGLK